MIPSLIAWALAGAQFQADLWSASGLVFDGSFERLEVQTSCEASACPDERYTVRISREDYEAMIAPQLNDQGFTHAALIPDLEGLVANTDVFTRSRKDANGLQCRDDLIIGPGQDASQLIVSFNMFACVDMQQ